MKRHILLLVALVLMAGTFAFDFSVNGIFYKIKENNTKVAVTLSSETGNSYSGDVVIPSTVTYNNSTYSVTQIDLWAFMSSHSLTSITIPNSVDTISDGAFWGCIKMTTLAIPASVKKIGNYVFYGCDALTQITVDGANTHFASADGLLYNKNKNILLSYPAGKPETVYTIAASVDTIGNMAFGHCAKLVSITIPGTVVYITGHAFTQCNALTSMYIPASVKYFDNNPFYDCAGMTAVNVDPANQFNESVDGVLFKKGMERIIYYPPAKAGSSYVIPSSVTGTRSSVFMNCKNLTSVTIPSSIQSIRSGLFTGCSSLTRINAYSEVPVDLTNTIPGNNSDKVFEGVDTLHCVLHVPVGSRALYAAAFQWKGFSNIVEGFAAGFPATKTSNLRVTALNRQIYISGYTPGEEITVYNTQGMTLYKQNATTTTTTIKLNANGVYMVKAGVDRVKVFL